MNKARIATGATIFGLAGLAGVALNANHQPQPADVGASRPLVRTQVVHRTIHVTRHAKPKSPSAAGPRPGSAAAMAAPVTTGASSAGSAAAPSPGSAPVTTSTSGASSAAPAESTSPPVVTQASGGSAAAPAGEAAAPVTTATSGGGAGGAGGGDGGEREGRDG